MSKQGKVIVALSIVVAVLVFALVDMVNFSRIEEYNEARRNDRSFNTIPFCMRVAEAYVNGDTEQIYSMAAKIVQEDGIPNLEAYAELDLAFSGLKTHHGDGPGEINGAPYCTIRYRLLSPVPEALRETIPDTCIEHRDGKDYIYQYIYVNGPRETEGDSKEETYGWSFVPGNFKGTPFSGPGSETVMWDFLTE